MADAPRILIVTSRYYAHIAAELEAGVVEALDAAGAEHDFVEVPGAFELPGAIAMAAGMEEYDGYVALGCVIRGETSHYDLICNEVARGLMDAKQLDKILSPAAMTQPGIVNEAPKP